jgi:putative ATP-dependent endonuclease of the OLD family
MKFSGFEFRNFRSIGENPIHLYPLYKCNILIGRNNAGKSNIVRAILKICDYFSEKTPILENIDLHKRTEGNNFTFRLIFDLEEVEEDLEIKKYSGLSKVFFEFDWVQSNNAINHITNSFLELDSSSDPNRLLILFTGKHWESIPSAKSVKSEFLQNQNLFFRKFKTVIPQAFLIPEFRRIQGGDLYTMAGDNLIRRLANFKEPSIGNDTDEYKFQSIQGFTRQLLNLPQAELQIAREDSSLIIKNNNLRLPLSSFGTGAHELIILVTAVLSQENSIICIEEPEIHFHPKMLKDFIDFIKSNTNNTYIISSHSASLINYGLFDSEMGVNYCFTLNENTFIKPVKNNSEAYPIIKELGVNPSDLLQSNCIIWVEGFTDQIYIRRWLYLLAPDLREGFDYIFVTYRERKSLNISRNDFSEDLFNIIFINQNAIIVADQDRKSSTDSLSPQKQVLIEKCKAENILFWLTEGKEIENYLTPWVIKRSIKRLRKVNIDISIDDYDDFSEVIDKSLRQIGKIPLEYKLNKSNLAAVFAMNFLRSDLRGNLLDQMNLIVETIRKWK